MSDCSKHEYNCYHGYMFQAVQYGKLSQSIEMFPIICKYRRVLYIIIEM